jgi:predicted Rossmann fold flavoprotein
MDLSGFVEELAGDCELILDLAPDRTLEDLDSEWLKSAATQGRASPAALLPRNLPERLRRTLSALAGAEGTVAKLSRERRRRLLGLLKDCRLPVARSLGLGHAEVTRGGIPLDEVDPRTMQSKIVPGLFLCGEILDVDGPIGGFNFQAAFATGRLAGLHA